MTSETTCAACGKRPVGHGKSGTGRSFRRLGLCPTCGQDKATKLARRIALGFRPKGALTDSQGRPILAVKTGTAAGNCRRCGKRPVPKVNRGSLGAARKKGVCWECYKSLKTSEAGGAKGARRRKLAHSPKGLARAFAELERTAVQAIKDEGEALVTDTRLLIDRVFARIDEIGRRRRELAQVMERIERQAREATAELRREVKRVRGAGVSVRREIRQLPKSAPERAAEIQAREDAEEKDREEAAHVRTG